MKITIVKDFLGWMNNNGVEKDLNDQFWVDLSFDVFFKSPILSIEVGP